MIQLYWLSVTQNPSIEVYLCTVFLYITNVCGANMLLKLFLKILHHTNSFASLFFK